MKIVKFNFKLFIVKFVFFAVVAVIIIAIFHKIGELITAAKLVEMGGETVTEAFAEAVEAVDE